MRVDLNCDMGESFGTYSLGADAAVMPLITSANIACGFHAGDPQVMRRTVRLAREHGVSVGAHPGFRDLVGFGRRPMQCTPDEIYSDVLYQIGAIAGVCRAERVALRHVKPHGALYNMAAVDAQVAEAIAMAVRDFDPALHFFVLPGSHLQRAGEQVGLRVVCEAFGDRAYTAEGTLLSRGLPGAVLHTPARVVEQVRCMLLHGQVVAVTGERVAVRADTICVHGDHPSAVQLLTAMREALMADGVTLAAPAS